MAIRKIFKEGEAVLRKTARKVERFDDRLEELAQDMLETMKEANGIGLAANQVGILKRMFVMNLDSDEDGEPGEGDIVIINPEIISREGEQEQIEGCLSLPGLYAHVKRPQRLHLRYQDLAGNIKEMEVEGLKAVCICHESDHLDGVLFRDKAEESLFTLDKNGQAYRTESGKKLR